MQQLAVIFEGVSKTCAPWACSESFVARFPLATIVAAQCPPDQVILNGPSLGNGVNVGSTPRESRTDWLSNDGSALIAIPIASVLGCVVFFTFGAAGPVGNRRPLDLSGCSNLVLEISGDPGSVDVGVQDWQQHANWLPYPAISNIWEDFPYRGFSGRCFCVSSTEPP